MKGKLDVLEKQAIAFLLFPEIIKKDDHGLYFSEKDFDEKWSKRA